MPSFEASYEFPVPVEELFQWHKRPGAFERLAPPWESMKVIERQGGIENGGRLTFEIRKIEIPVKWTAEHQEYIENQQFCDVQVSGPFKSWRHFHRFESTKDGSRLIDSIDYELPGGQIGQALGESFTQSMLKRMFRFRHLRTYNDLQRHSLHASQQRKKIVISGASGLVGAQLASFLGTGGHEVYRLVRRAPDSAKNEIYWNPSSQKIDSRSLEGMDAVVHLAGENIAGGRWTEERKMAIRRSRTDGTHLIADALANLDKKPGVFISASAIGYYGNRGDEILTEESNPGKGFLADTCTAWESSANPAREAGIRVVHPRIGLVLSPQGGALAKMLPVFKMGVAGPLGDGKMFMSWIALDDLVGMLHHNIMTNELTGPVNAVAPNPVRNKEFTKTLASVLNRPAVLPAPEFALKMALGEMADQLLLQSARVIPETLNSSSFSFLYPELEQALRNELCLYS